MAEPFPWGRFKNAEPTRTLILTGAALDVQAVPQPIGCTHSPRRCCLSQHASRISCSSWYLMAREAFPSSSRGRSDRFTLAWVQFEAKHVSRSSCRLWNCGDGIGAVCVSNERNGQNQSDPAPCWVGVRVHRRVKEPSFPALSPSLCFAWKGCASPGNAAGLRRVAEAGRGKAQRRLPSPCAGKGSAEDSDVTQGARTLPSLRTHRLHSGPPGEDAAIGLRAILQKPAPISAAEPADRGAQPGCGKPDQAGGRAKGRGLSRSRGRGDSGRGLVAMGLVAMDVMAMGLVARAISTGSRAQPRSGCPSRGSPAPPGHPAAPPEPSGLRASR